MAAANLQLMAANLPFDFLPNHHPHSRSASVSSASSHSSSRPHSSQGGLLPNQNVAQGLPSIGAAGIGASMNMGDDLYRSAYSLGLKPSHTRHSSSSTAFSTDLASPADSPPNHHALANAALKTQSGLRQTHIRAARAATSPYPRDAESVYSSSSENEDMSLFFSNPSPPDYTQMYIQSQQGTPAHLHQHSQDAFHTAGQFGRMTLGPDHALEQLAANVRAATTTSASDRAKQIFVQAWYASLFFSLSRFSLIYENDFHARFYTWF